MSATESGRRPRRHRRRLVRRVLPLLATLGLVLAACGTDEPAAMDPEEPTTAESAPAEAEEPDEAALREAEPAEDPVGQESEANEGADGASGAAEEAAGDEAAGDEAATVVPDLLDFTAPAVGGGQVAGADAAGHPVALWFWAPWCPSCNREAPEAAQLAHDFGEEVRFIGVAGLDDMSEMEDFVATHDVGHFPHAATEDGALWVRFGVSSQPAWIVLDADGEVALSGIRPSLSAVRDALEEVSASG